MNDAKARQRAFKEKLRGSSKVCAKHGALPKGFQFCTRCHPEMCGIHGITLAKYESCPECVKQVLEQSLEKSGF